MPNPDDHLPDADLAPLHRITLREIRLPLVEPFVISSGREDERRILLLTLRDADGVEAWSECVAMATPNYSPETIDSCWQMIRQHVAPRVLGKELASPQAVHAALQPAFRGHWMAKAAVEMGCWGLAAERQGVSLAGLLGGTRERIEVGISLGIQPSSDHLCRKVEGALEAGYRKVKIKIRPGRDLDDLRQACRVAGSGSHLMADANSAYSLSDIPHLRQFDDLGLMMIEQPLAWDDLRQHGELQRQLITPICLDESITDVAKAADMVALGSGRIINIKPGRVGGLSSSLEIHDLCRRLDVAVWCGGMLESGIGRAYNVALASLPGFTLPGDVSPSARYWSQDIVTPEWTMDDTGHVQVPFDRPGIGVEVDVERIEQLTVRSEVLDVASQ